MTNHAQARAGPDLADRSPTTRKNSYITYTDLTDRSFSLARLGRILAVARDIRIRLSATMNFLSLSSYSTFEGCLGSREA